MSQKNTTTRRAVIYARLSVSSDQSVSIARQVEACRKYADSQGWQVVATFADDGVSATKNHPTDRQGWRDLLAWHEVWDVAVVWKIDRLSRNFLQFWATCQDLLNHGRSLASVTENFDLVSPVGKIVASVLAGAAEMEATNISARVAGARQHLIREGRVVGGKVPYGWRSVDNPEGPGKVLAQDPETIDFVRGLLGRIQQGVTVYAAMQWLNEVGAPTPTGGAAWVYSTVERVVRHPVLAGMTPFNPGNTDTKVRGGDVLRDETGLPLVNEALAIMPVAEWRQLVTQLDDRSSAQARPRAMKGTTSSLLSGLVWCGEHDEAVRMYRGTAQGRPGYNCPTCHQTITGFEAVVVEEFLAAKGEWLRWRVVEEVHEGGAALLPEIEHRLDELDGLIRQAGSRNERTRLQVEQANLLDLRDEKRAETPQVSYRWEGTDQSFGEDWADATSVEDRRAVLDDALTRVTVTRGGRGRRTRAQLLARLVLDWKGEVGPMPTPDETWVA